MAWASLGESTLTGVQFGHNELGADVTINYREEDFVEVLKADGLAEIADGPCLVALLPIGDAPVVECLAVGRIELYGAVVHNRQCTGMAKGDHAHMRVRQSSVLGNVAAIHFGAREQLNVAFKSDHRLIFFINAHGAGQR